MRDQEEGSIAGNCIKTRLYLTSTIYQLDFT